MEQREPHPDDVELESILLAVLRLDYSSDKVETGMIVDMYDWLAEVEKVHRITPRRQKLMGAIAIKLTRAMDERFAP
ncbi:hypothetical protein [Naasia lichenicola]|uniref:Uncharacterized protein n=1 Tax=Naasia lichenicola TaxID=2565933 RepID=A0A4V3WT55_9MICO|nr:hypothetical protein [Naasia lichenicola]THG30687.1 hypothetical protein E6C64_08585 [Naasia lichenicola]THG31924.1 hypothetical protein E6C64_07730 [Naasia lichenicola]